MTSKTLRPPPLFDLPGSRLEARRRHLVSELTREAPRLRASRLVLPAAVAALAALVLVVAPWRGGGSSVVDRALAAVGAGPVVHAVVEYSWPQDVVINVATGVERERVHRAEYWFDGDRKRLHARYTTDGGTPVDYVASGDEEAQLDASLAGFATQYRDALADGRAEYAGETTFMGRPAKRIRFTPRSAGAVEEVTVDAETYAPVTFHTTYPPGRRSPEWRVLTIESTPRVAADFVTPPSEPRVDTGEVSGGRNVSLTAAAGALGGSPPHLAGRVPDDVQLSRAKVWMTDGRTPEGVVVRLAYGDVTVSVSRDEAGRDTVGFGNDEYPVPPAGSMAVTGNRNDGFQGVLRFGEFGVMISAPQKDQVIAAARALRD
jgi:hypothetical protein